MRPAEANDALCDLITARVPALLIGQPGIGKTDLVRQVAHQLDRDVIVDYPIWADPTDYQGLPMDAGGHIERKFDKSLIRILETTRPTIWFLDEIGQAPASVQAALAPIILSRQIGGREIPDHVSFVAATNRRHDRAGADR